MPSNFEEILFPKDSEKNFDDKILILKSLFNEDNEKQYEYVSLDICYFLLKRDVKLDDDIIYKNSKIIGVGFSEDDNMINVCYNLGNIKKYFWVNIDDVDEPVLVNEKWRIEEANLHNKAIKEKWTKDKNI